MFETLLCGYQSKHKPDSWASQSKSHTSKWGKKMHNCYCRTERSHERYILEKNLCSTPSVLQVRTLRKWDFRGEDSRFQKAKVFDLIYVHCSATCITLKVIKIQQYLQAFNLLFNMNLYLLDRYQKAGKGNKIIRKPFSIRMSLFWNSCAS